MTDVVLGTKPDRSAERDAIHVAVVPMIAAEMLRPGQCVGLVSVGAGPSENIVGVVDPYLTDVVPKGDRFWLCLLPNSVSGMRHHWSHPLFPDKPNNGSLDQQTKEESEAWLSDFINTAGCPDYETVIAAASGGHLDPVHAVYGPAAYTNDGEYLHFKGLDAHGEIPDEFWGHVENVTGKRCTLRPSNFSCSC